MPDTPNIKRFEEWLNVARAHGDGPLSRDEENVLRVVGVMLNDLADHLERLEAGFLANHHPHRFTDTEPGDKPYIGTTPPTNTAP